MKILLAVTGSISAYKALDICRGLTKRDHDVRVITTRGASEFINPNTFHYLGAQKVYSSQDDFNLEQYEGSTNVLHIDLVRWCDKLVIAPASANTIAKLSHGLCDDLLSSCFLALGQKPCLIFPAMNTQMLSHEITQENITRLKKLKNLHMHPTGSGELACGDIGAGKLATVDEIIDVVPLIKNENTDSKNILITTGATISPLDPVRYITNPSSGKTGYELAKSYLAKGHKVTLICGYNTTELIQNLINIPNIEVINAQTTKQMGEAVQKYFNDSDVYISTAAMSDIEFDVSDNKIKKSDMENSITFNKAIDVLGTVLKQKKNQKVIGFAAETNSDEATFLEKWNRKPVDLLVGNIVSNGALKSEQGFNQDQNEYFFIKEGKVADAKQMTKEELSQYIVSESLS